MLSELWLTTLAEYNIETVNIWLITVNICIRETICPHCGGRMLTEKARADARKGGNASYLKSLEPGQLSMSERGKRGGNPKDGGYTGPSN